MEKTVLKIINDELVRQFLECGRISNISIENDRLATIDGAVDLVALARAIEIAAQTERAASAPL